MTTQVQHKINCNWKGNILKICVILREALDMAKVQLLFANPHVRETETETERERERERERVSPTCNTNITCTFLWKKQKVNASNNEDPICNLSDIPFMQTGIA